jgi:hypothetical protein
MHWVFFAVMLGGQLTWLFSAHLAEQWLRENDPEFEPPGFASRFFLGRLISSFGPMARYASMRRERNEPTTLVAAFWGGFAVSILGLILFLVFMTQL